MNTEGCTQRKRPSHREKEKKNSHGKEKYWENKSKKTRQDRI